MTHQTHPQRSYYAFVAHRLSGIALAVFLPAHFYVLGLALTGTDQLDRFLSFTALPLVKAAETGLIVLLTIHLVFGVRLLMMELLPWPDERNLRGGLVDIGLLVSIAIGACFVWSAL